MKNITETKLELRLCKSTRLSRKLADRKMEIGRPAPDTLVLLLVSPGKNPLRDPVAYIRRGRLGRNGDAIASEIVARWNAAIEKA